MCDLNGTDPQNLCVDRLPLLERYYFCSAYLETLSSAILKCPRNSVHIYQSQAVMERSLIEQLLACVTILNILIKEVHIQLLLDGYLLIIMMVCFTRRNYRQNLSFFVGLSEPRSKSVRGGPLPSCRRLSLAFGSKPVFERKFNNFWVIFGQLIGHDIALAYPVSDTYQTPISSCSCNDKRDYDRCTVIDIDKNDPYLAGQKCIAFPATAQAFPDQVCSLGEIKLIFILEASISAFTFRCQGTNEWK